MGLSSQYTYGSNQFVTALVTPYGTTTFGSDTTNGVTSLQATDPLGESELLQSIPNDAEDPITGDRYSSSEQLVPNEWLPMLNYAGLEYGSSFFWGKRAFQAGAGVFTNATIYQFCGSPDYSTESGVLASVKQPLENRVFYQYSGGAIVDYDHYWAPFIASQGINQPSAVGRVLDDGTTQLRLYQYNALGLVTNATDPAGRNFTYVYSTNNLDLLAVLMTSNGKNELQTTITYNPQHLPLTVTDASGQTTTNTYNARGQILTTTDPLGEATTLSYDTKGYVLSITGPLQTTNDVMRLTYDAFGRPRTFTDTEGYTLTYAYDALDRITSITHPDETYEQFVYTFLDLTGMRDRLGRWTTNTYNADRQLIQTQDPLGRVTRYDWCECGAMTGLIDPMGRQTTWDYDIQSRPIAKHYVDGSTISCVYENTTSRLNYRLDERGQQTVYQYNIDDTLASVSHPNATVPTPSVALTYDPDYNRILSMQDGVGLTVYTYNPITPAPPLGAGRLASVSGPLPNSTVTYQYDPLGRVASRAINGVAQAIAYDVLGRPITVTNGLGTFQYAYVDATPRLALEAYPNGQTNLYSYYNNLGDQRLLQIQHLYPNGSLLSGFGYGYNVVGQIIAWTNQWDTLPTRVWCPTYDAADELTNVIVTGTGWSVTNYAYAYDPAGNRLLAATNGVASLLSYSALNHIVGSSVTLPSVSYEWDAENRLTAISYGPRRSEFTYDGLGRRVEIVEKTNGVVMTGNYFRLYSRICGPKWRSRRTGPVLQGGTQWRNAALGWGNDEFFALDRGLQQHPPERGEWSPDAGHAFSGRFSLKTGRFPCAGRRRLPTDSAEEAYFLWCGGEISEERDPTGASAVRRFFPQGEALVGSGNSEDYFYARDHLRTVREAVDRSGVLNTRYDYDPYGQRGVVQQTLATTFAYTGEFIHVPSALYLTLHRALSPSSGRWISRDPAQEGAGLNLYDYVGGDPINRLDLSGLQATSQECSALAKFVNYADQQSSPLSVAYSPEYNGFGLGANNQTADLDYPYDTIVGPVSADWMLRVASNQWAGIDAAAYASYFTEKVFWNTAAQMLKNFEKVTGGGPLSSLYFDPFNNLMAPKNFNAPCAASLWYSGIPLSVIFGPALQQCAQYNITSSEPLTGSGDGGSCSTTLP